MSGRIKVQITGHRETKKSRKIETKKEKNKAERNRGREIKLGSKEKIKEKRKTRRKI